MGDESTLTAWTSPPISSMVCCCRLPDPTHAQLNTYTFLELFNSTFEAGYTDLIHTPSMPRARPPIRPLSRPGYVLHDHPKAQGTFSIEIIDSRTYTMAYGWAVVEGARLAAGGASAQEASDLIRDWLDHARVLFAPWTCASPRSRGASQPPPPLWGRHWAQAGDDLRGWDSKILSKVRGERNVVASLVSLCQKEHREGTPWLLIRGNNLEQAAKLRDAVPPPRGRSRLGVPRWRSYRHQRRSQFDRSGLPHLIGLPSQRPSVGRPLFSFSFSLRQPLTNSFAAGKISEPQHNRTQGRWEPSSRLRCRGGAASGPSNLIRVIPA